MSRRAPTASQARSGSVFPFADTGSVGRYSIACRVALSVASSTRIPPGRAADCRRAPTFMTSPAAMPSPELASASSWTSASPVAMPTRIIRSSERSRSLSSSIARWIAIPACTARSASSSCATGAPKIATTASPMNFSTVPPKPCSSSCRRVRYGASRAWMSSGSAPSAAAVEPTRSAYRQVTVFRSSCTDFTDGAGGRAAGLLELRAAARAEGVGRVGLRAALRAAHVEPRAALHAESGALAGLGAAGETDHDRRQCTPEPDV